MKMHYDKRRGRMDIDDIGIEAFIHWNGPPLQLSEKLSIKSLDRHFRGRGRWNFVTRANKSDTPFFVHRNMCARNVVLKHKFGILKHLR